MPVVTGVLASHLVQDKAGIPDRFMRNVTLESVINYSTKPGEIPKIQVYIFNMHNSSTGFHKM